MDMISGVFYLTLGLGVHAESMDCPEVCFGGNTLAKLEVGYEQRVSRNQFLVVNYEHISNPLIREAGYGMNTLWVETKFTF